ncbi:hypothetical protein OGAPHI_002757 [Ogataea philodendri]|uniref:Ubiquitin-like domain-containing protein n=1 Tax=Ogataea philodendri TaxID=1378263 RepID=A0A9P8PBL6_9ASCO|nr:uncharacterized protein OGAPHI_002757 [Ogataea philodendri]KAH3669002.1 hypothetical protein OGAPHI_002757 [Ogataea philodendri]
MSRVLPLDSSDLKTPKTVQFVVRFANGASDVVIPVGSVANLDNVSTKFIRQQIRIKDKSLATKRLKLIHNGKVLLNHTDFKKELRYLLRDESTGSDPIRIYIHCIVGDELSREELAQEEELEHQPEKSTSEAPKGFDRLLSQGFSALDIQELRHQFQQIHGASLDNQSQEALRELEDRWIDSTVNHEIDEFPANIGTLNAGGNGGGGPASRDGDAHKDLLIGVAIGYFLGIFALFLIKLEIGGVFNKRTRMAVIAGVFVNLSFGFVKAWS